MLVKFLSTVINDSEHPHFLHAVLLRAIGTYIIIIVYKAVHNLLGQFKTIMQRQHINVCQNDCVCACRSYNYFISLLQMETPKMFC